MTGTESATEDETSADNLESSDDDAEISQGRVRDRGAPLLETQKYWNAMDTEHDLDAPESSHQTPTAYGERMYSSRTPAKAKAKWPRASGSSSGSKRQPRSRNDFDEGVSDDQHDDQDDSSRSRSRSPRRRCRARRCGHTSRRDCARQRRRAPVRSVRPWRRGKCPCRMRACRGAVRTRRHRACTRPWPSGSGRRRRRCAADRPTPRPRGVRAPHKVGRPRMRRRAIAKSRNSSGWPLPPCSLA